MNGWIFPYRQRTVQTEAASTNLRVPVVRSFGFARLVPVGSVAVVGQRRGDTEWEPAAEVVFRGQARSPSHRQIRAACGRGVMMGAFRPDIRWSRPSRKASARGALPPVPQTDTGGQVENTKAIERILVKELGKSLPCLRYKGDPCW